MKIAIVTVLALAGACAMPLAAHADDEADLQIAGQTIGELVTAEAMLSAALDGECSQHASENFRIMRETLRLNIADLKEVLPPSSKQKITEQLNREEFQSQLNTFRKKAVDETLALLRGKGVSPAFACGYVFGTLAEPLARSEQHRLRALKQLGK
jgi:hypothetical protein